MRPVWLASLVLATAVAMLSPAALAQIEVKQNGDVVLGTAGVTPVTVTTVNGDGIVVGKLTVRGTSTVLGTGPTSNTTISGSLTAPILNAPNTAITGDVTLGAPGANPPSVTTINGYLSARWLTSSITNIVKNASVGGNLNAPYLTAATTTITGSLNAARLTAPTTTVTGNLNAATLSAATTTITGNLNAATLTAPTTTVTGNLNAATLSAATTTITGNSVVDGTLTVAGTSNLANVLLFAQSDGTTQSTSSSTFVNMQGLALTLPASTPNADTAIVTLNVPNPYATGNNFPGGQFAIAVNAQQTGPTATFTSFLQQFDRSWMGPGRVPTTLVVKVPLGTSTTAVTAMWLSVRSATVFTDSPSTLSAVLGKLSP